MLLIGAKKWLQNRGIFFARELTRHFSPENVSLFLEFLFHCFFFHSHFQNLLGPIHHSSNRSFHFCCKLKLIGDIAILPSWLNLETKEICKSFECEQLTWTISYWFMSKISIDAFNNPTDHLVVLDGIKASKTGLRQVRLVHFKNCCNLERQIT